MESDIKKKIDDVHRDIYGNGTHSVFRYNTPVPLPAGAARLTTITVSQFFLLIGVALKTFLGA